MASSIFWILLLVVQGRGTVGVEFGTETECKETREQVKSNADVLAMSECQVVTVTGRPPERGEVGAK